MFNTQFQRFNVFLSNIVIKDLNLSLEKKIQKSLNEDDPSTFDHFLSLE